MPGREDLPQGPAEEREGQAPASRMRRALLRGAPAAAVLGFAALAGVLKIRSVDFFWHLAAGRWMLTHGSLPHHDPFRFTSQGVPWVDHEWAFQLLLALVEKGGGLGALVLARAGLFVLLGALLFAACRRQGAPPAPAALVTLAALVGLRGRLLFRPELITLLGVALLLTLLARLRRGRGLRPGPILSLLALTAVWANFHPGVLAAPILAAAWLLGSRLGPPPPGAERIPRWQLAGVPAAMALAILANPWGAEVYRVPGRIAAALSELPATNPDWAPLWKSPQPLLLLALAGLVALGAVTWRRGQPGSGRWLGGLDGASGLVVLALLPLVASSARHQGLLWIAGAFFAGACLGRLAGSGRLAPGWEGASGAAACGLLAAAALAWCLPAAGVSRWRPGHEAGFGVVPGLFPAAGVEEIARWEPVGNLFNSAAFGGYLLWRLYPPRQVFYDTRNEVAPELLRELAAARSSAVAWEALVERHGIDGALVRYEDRPRAVLAAEQASGPGAGDPPAVEYRTTSALLFPPERFALVWWDDLAMLFLARTPGRGQALAVREYRHVQPEDWRHTLTLAARDSAFREGLAGDLRRKLREDPSCRRAAELLAAVEAMGSAGSSSPAPLFPPPQ